MKRIEWQTDLGLFGFDIDNGGAGLRMTMVFVCDEDGKEARWVVCDEVIL